MIARPMPSPWRRRSSNTRLTCSPVGHKIGNAIWVFRFAGGVFAGSLQ